MADNKLFVGGLPFSYTEADLTNLAQEFGDIQSATIVFDKINNRSRGFGFVEFSSDEEAQAAIKALDGKEVDGRKITVNVAKPLKPREDRGGYRGGDRGGDRGGYNRNRY